MTKVKLTCNDASRAARWAESAKRLKGKILKMRREKPQFSRGYFVVEVSFLDGGDARHFAEIHGGDVEA